MTLKFFHFPLRKRITSSVPFTHQSSPMARAMPMTPICSPRPRMKDSAVRQTTVAKMELHRVNCTSPAARRPDESGDVNGCITAAKQLWMMTMIHMRVRVSSEMLYSGRISGTRARTRAFQTIARTSVIRVSLRIYQSAASGSCAPMHWPMTVIKTGHMETDMQAASDQMV